MEKFLNGFICENKLNQDALLSSASSDESMTFPVKLRFAVMSNQVIPQF
jgi:hypothetical protein